jgi:hypothetical protein
VQLEAAKIGDHVPAREVKGGMRPAVLKRAFAEATNSKPADQSTLERARGESFCPHFNFTSR